MKVIKYISGFLLITVLISSCSIEQNYHFNEDFSGTSETILDFSMIMALTPDSTKEEMDNIVDDEDVLEYFKKFEETPGLTNGTFSEKEGVVNLKFDFENFETLKAFGESGDGKSMGDLSANNAQWELKGNKLLIDFTPKEDMWDELSKDGSLGELGSMEDIDDSMEEMLKMKINLSFDKQIKKVKSKMGVWNKEDNTITYSYSMKQMADKKTNWKTEVRFK